LSEIQLKTDSKVTPLILLRHRILHSNGFIKILSPRKSKTLQKFNVNVLLQELEEIYTDLCSTVTEAVIQGAEIVSSRVSGFTFSLSRISKFKSQRKIFTCKEF